MLLALAYLWCAWAGAHVVILLLLPYIYRDGSPFTNGIVVVVPPTAAAFLTPVQLRAVIAHECGHIVRLHVWKCLAKRCFFIPHTRAAFERQEIEADDFAAEYADPVALATALRRLSTDPFDLYRAERLEAM